MGVVRRRHLLLTAAWLPTAQVAAADGMWQDRLLYFPDRVAVEALVGAGLRPWPAKATFRGLLAEPAGPVRATLVVFHGNAGHAGHRAAYAAALGPLGLRTILAEYPGYGPRDGALGEASLVADATQTLALAHREFGAPLLVLGESLGAGVAAAAVARQPTLVDGLMLVTPWDRLRHVAGHHYPWLPVGWLLRDRYDSVANLAQFAGRKLVVVAEHDALVPPAFGRALYEQVPAPKRWMEVAGAGHNDWIGRVDAAWWSRAVAWLLGEESAR